MPLTGYKTTKVFYQNSQFVVILIHSTLTLKHSVNYLCSKFNLVNVCVFVLLFLLLCIIIANFVFLLHLFACNSCLALFLNAGKLNSACRTGIKLHSFSLTFG